MPKLVLTLVTFASAALTTPALASDVRFTRFETSEQARKACSLEGQELRQRILAGTANAKQEADLSTARGCFGLISTFASIPRGVAYAPGVECSPNSPLFRYGRLELFSFAGSDVVTGGMDQASRELRDLLALTRFALDYNAFVVAHPDFPYSDFCRLAAPDYRPAYHYSRDRNLNSWGLRPLKVSDQPRDLHEAARRGTLKSLRRMLSERPDELDVADLLGLSALAWAVIYDRPDHVALLLAAGASPHGSPLRNRPISTSPITLAREGGLHDLERLMLAATKETSDKP